jgi:RimJ/RimL family protein N-acetyltransferase
MTTSKKPILLDFPDEIITERLHLRAPRPGDGALVHPVVLANQEHLKPWMPWAAEIPTAEEYEALVREWQIKFMRREELPFLLFWRDTGAYIGGSGMHNIKWDVPKFEIGYWLAQEFVGQGIMLEAVQAITTFLFGTLGAKRVEIRCDVNNERSAAVARRAGYALEGTLINSGRHHLTQQLRGSYIFAKTAPDDAPA